ncbi:uncharacterized protein ACRADG_006850 [Cochliomyia hominivorax]
MLHKNLLLTYALLVLLPLSSFKSATEAITPSDIFQTKQLKQQLETLKDHLEDAIQKLDHNIRSRQAEFQAEVQTPDNEYIEAALGMQRNDLINAAAIPQIPLPARTMRINQNSGLRRRRSNLNGNFSSQ